DHPAVADSLTSLAVLFQLMDDHASARPLLKRALAIWEKALGPDNTRVAMGLSNLAVTERHNGDYAAARSLYERALVIFEKTIGPGADFATCMNNLGDLLDDMGDYATAGPLHERALSIQKQTLGPDHPDVAMSLDSLARWHAVKGETAGALEAALEVERISLE